MQLGGIIEKLDDVERQVRRRAPAEPRAQIRGLRRSIDEALAVVHLFAQGFAAARAGERSPEFVAIAGFPQRGASASLRLFTLFASAELELFVREFATWWLTPAEVARFRRMNTTRGDIRHLAADYAKAREQIVGWLKPSAPSRPPTWPARARHVFRCRVDAPVAEAIVTLIKWRNEFSHPARRRPRVRWNGTDVGEVMVAWLLAIIILGVRLGEASFRRRA
jgi:hypothetical protein